MSLILLLFAVLASIVSAQVVVENVLPCADPNCKSCPLDVNHCALCISDRYYVSASSTCQLRVACDAATLLSCKTCTYSPTVCDQCWDTHYLSGSACLPRAVCDPTSNCYTCTSSPTTCDSCSDGYIWSDLVLYGSTCQQRKHCRPGINCETCTTSDTTCDNCFDGFYLAGDNACYPRAPCAATLISTSFNCAACATSPFICDCQLFASDSAFYGGGCVFDRDFRPSMTVLATNPQCDTVMLTDPLSCINCADGFILAGNNCLPCPLNCTHCDTNPYVCTTCEDSFFWNGTHCESCGPGISSCTALGVDVICSDGGDFVIDGQCLAPDPTNSCPASNNTDCSSSLVCFAPALASQYVCTRILGGCNPGFFLSNDGVNITVDYGFFCQPCPSLPGCQVDCTVAADCSVTTCDTGYVFDLGGNCVVQNPCDPSVNNCNSCDINNTTQCDICYNGYVLASGQCNQCNSSQYMVPGNATVAAACIDCPSILNCNSVGCGSDGVSYCSQAGTGYLLVVGGYLRSCGIDNCDTCNQVGICSTCLKGFVLQDGFCLSDPGVANCWNFTSYGSCDLCAKGYTTNNGYCVNSSLFNIALGKFAAQSSTFTSYGANDAISGLLSQTSYSSTLDGDNQPSWNVNLGTNYILSAIRISKPLVSNWLNFQVAVTQSNSSTVFTQNYTLQRWQPNLLIPFSPTILGGYVTVSKLPSPTRNDVVLGWYDRLELTQVEVYSQSISNPCLTFNGQCEDTCEPIGPSSRICKCLEANSILNADGKTCGCQAGYQKIGTACVAVNLCYDGTFNCQDKCVYDGPGKAHCNCTDPNAQLAGDSRSCKCFAGFEQVGAYCILIDLCKIYGCPDQSISTKTCTNGGNNTRICTCSLNSLDVTLVGDQTFSGCGLDWVLPIIIVLPLFLCALLILALLWRKRQKDALFYVGDLPVEIKYHFSRDRIKAEKWSYQDGLYFLQLDGEHPDYRKLEAMFNVYLNGSKTEIERAYAVYNPVLVGNFANCHKIQRSRYQQSPALFFAKKWVMKDDGPKQTVYDHYDEFKSQFLWNGKEDPVSIVPTLHGASESVAWSICKSGFAALSSLDAGYYGKGIYFSTDCMYISPYFAKSDVPAIIISFILPGNVFPVTEDHGGPQKLLGLAMKAGYQSHYVLVDHKGSVPDDYKDISYLFSEVVVEQESQIVPVYLVLPSQKGCKRALNALSKSGATTEKRKEMRDKRDAGDNEIELDTLTTTGSSKHVVKPKLLNTDVEHV